MGLNNNYMQGRNKTTITMLLTATLISYPSVSPSHSLAVISSIVWMILDWDTYYWADFLEEARVEVDKH